MGFHCGNTPICRLRDDAAIKYQLIMKRSLEPDGEPDITRGTLEGDMMPSVTTMFRLHSAPDTKLQAYIAQGEILPTRTGSFGGIGVFAFPNMERFYRNVLVGKHYPHHTAVAFDHIGSSLFEIFRYFGVGDVEYNRPAGERYPGENPFGK
jgi:L-fucose isomerase-like protein